MKDNVPLVSTGQVSILVYSWQRTIKDWHQTHVRDDKTRYLKDTRTHTILSFHSVALSYLGDMKSTVKTTPSTSNAAMKHE